MRFFIKALKLILTAIILISFDLTFRYILEELNLVSVTPRSVPNYVDRHVENVYSWIPYVFVTMGWVYFITALLYHFSVKLIKNNFVKLVFGVSLCFLAFFIYWIIEDFNKIDYGLEELYEGLIVYFLLGIVLFFSNSLFFKSSLN